ncbi:MAG: PIN domain-containing protein [Candidatus Peregrinibacteria bacterium]
MNHIKKFTIDANVFVSFLLESEENHIHSRKFMEFIFESGVIFPIPMIIIFEVFQSLRKHGYFEEEGNYIKFNRIFDSDAFKYIDVDEKLFEFFRKFNFFWSLKTSDAIIATSALATNSTLISWDKRLVKASHNGYTPAEFLKEFS